MNGETGRSCLVAVVGSSPALWAMANLTFVLSSELFSCVSRRPPSQPASRPSNTLTALALVLAFHHGEFHTDDLMYRTRSSTVLVRARNSSTLYSREAYCTSRPSIHVHVVYRW